MLQHLARGMYQRVLRRQIVECQAVEKDHRREQQQGADKADERKPPGKLTRRSEEHTSELQSLMRISYAVFCLKKKNNTTTTQNNSQHPNNIKEHTQQLIT